MKIQSKVAMKGDLVITKRYADGKTEIHLDESNLIVFGGKNALLQALYSPTFVPNPISTLHVGTAGTIDPAGLYPKIPSSDLTSLYADIFNVPTSYSIVSSSVPSVTFLASISESQCNGTLLTEAGLFMLDTTMFNIKTYTGIPKTSSFAVDFSWTITVI